MNWISVDEIKGDFLGYIQRVEAGETIVILRGGKPVAEIKPTVKAPDASRPSRSV
ncbi:type II toxin-antitoxin system Phd/YefM family antitoxin [Nostoc sp.]|uniref:type II toxin-antitoxin system Phd/YefM family antitoxin n=1 Tax=Nostoc sp. TaxID=1180 RepID=UPI002FFB8777